LRSYQLETHSHSFILDKVLHFSSGQNYINASLLETPP